MVATGACQNRFEFDHQILVAAMSGSIDAIDKIIGYRFVSKVLLDTALTHRSAKGKNNERLEFLGDSVLGLLVAESLYRRFPECDEGALTRCRARLVRQETLAAIARENGLGHLVVLGDGAARSGGADRGSILADAIEALIGAVYLEGGLNCARTVVDRLLRDEWKTIDPSKLIKDPKTELQEQLQKFGRPLPGYHVKELRGAPHQREFVVECLLDEPAGSFLGKGSSRQKAEQHAAELALSSLSE